MGVIYVLTNPAFPDYVKIGYTKNIEDRLRQLNRSETIITPYILLSGISKDTIVVLRIFTALLAFGTIKLVLWATFFHPWYDVIVTLCICVIVPFKFCIILTTGFSDWFMLSYFPISCCFYIAKDLFVKRMSVY